MVYEARINYLPSLNCSLPIDSLHVLLCLTVGPEVARSGRQYHHRIWRYSHPLRPARHVAIHDPQSSDSRDSIGCSVEERTAQLGGGLRLCGFRPRLPWFWIFGSLRWRDDTKTLRVLLHDNLSNICTTIVPLVCNYQLASLLVTEAAIVVRVSEHPQLDRCRFPADIL